MEKSSPGTDNKRIKFKNPPLNELVIALFHLPLAELRAQHIGLYWNRIRNRYPVCEQQPPIVTPLDGPGLPGPLTGQVFLDMPGEVFPLPRFWFSGERHPTLIQVQRNAFLFNWRRGATNEYPHYEMVVEDFWEELNGYKAFVQESVGGNLDVIQRCELTYVNLIGPNEFFTDPTQLGKVLPLFASLHDFETDDRKLVGLNAAVTYRLNPTLLIDLTLRVGIRSDTAQPVLALELRAHGVPSDLSLEGAGAWYDAAHDAIYRLFLDSTNKQMQEEIWKPG